jgi:hypothetical protein
MLTTESPVDANNGGDAGRSRFPPTTYAVRGGVRVIHFVSIMMMEERAKILPFYLLELQDKYGRISRVPVLCKMFG